MIRLQWLMISPSSIKGSTLNYSQVLLKRLSQETGKRKECKREKTHTRFCSPYPYQKNVLERSDLRGSQKTSGAQREVDVTFQVDVTSPYYG